MLSACSFFKDRPGFAMFNRCMSVEGPTALLHDPSIETLELNKLFDLSFDNSAREESRSIKSWDEGFAYFERQVARRAESGDDLRRIRNGLQDRIIAASNQRCGEYKDFLKRFDSESNITLGWLATATAGAGAVTTPASAARVLSGIAAVLSGWRAEVNEAYLNKLTVQVVTNGIEGKRNDILTAISKRQKESLVDYSLQRAIADAATYHHNCSLISGLEHAALSIERADDPGIKRLKNILAEITEVRLASENLSALAGGDDNKVVLPLATFNKAKDARDRLAAKENELKVLPIPTTLSQDKATVAGASAEQNKERTDKLNMLNADIKKATDAHKQLLSEIAKLLAEGNPKFSDAERDKLDKLQKDIITTMTQVASSEDLQLKANARVTLRAQQQSASDSHHLHDGLSRRFNTKIAEAKSLINAATDLNARAQEF
jgi:hypothetical protein